MRPTTAATPRPARAWPSTTWFLAEGATHSSFDLFYLLQNPNPAPTVVEITYLLPSGTPLVKSYALAAGSRFNIWVNHEDPLLASTDVSAVIVSRDPIVVERAMYLSRPGRLFEAGTASTGMTSPALTWFLAEGATGDLFDLYVLIANPNPQAAAVEITYLLPGGGTVVRTRTIGARSRFTVWVDLEDARLASTAVSTIVKSTNGVPILVERAMWWPGGSWQEAHNSAGTTAASTEMGACRRRGRRRRQRQHLRPHRQRRRRGRQRARHALLRRRRHGNARPAACGAQSRDDRHQRHLPGCARPSFRHHRREPGTGAGESRRRAGDVFGFVRTAVGGRHQCRRHAAWTNRRARHRYDGTARRHRVERRCDGDRAGAEAGRGHDCAIVDDRGAHDCVLARRDRFARRLQPGGADGELRRRRGGKVGADRPGGRCRTRTRRDPGRRPRARRRIHGGPPGHGPGHADRR